MNIDTIREQLLDEDLCDHCLGRQFGQLGHGLENYERGVICRETDSLSEDDFDPDNVPDDVEPGGECVLCHGLFNQLSEFVDHLLDAVEGYEFDTYLIGSRIPDEWEEREHQLQESIGVEHAEPFNTELNRLLGKRFSVRYDHDVDMNREEPDVLMILDPTGIDVELQVSPLYIYGRYNKYVRDLPQTVWHCRSCRGSGCDQCDGTGKTYQESVQELIERPFVREASPTDTSFHGAGREDINARCLGKREFVLELKQPRRRDLDFSGLQEEVNETREKVEIFDVQRTRSRTVPEIKEQRADKTYRAVVDLEEPVDEETCQGLSQLEGEIEQETPSRVSHRRADRTRTRTVQSVEVTKTDATELELIIRAEAGTYIKELISGDENRTDPNVSSLLGTNATCRLLDVIEFHYEDRGNTEPPESPTGDEK